MFTYTIINDPTELTSSIRSWKNEIESNHVVLKDRMLNMDTILSYLSIHADKKTPYFIEVKEDNKLVAIAPFYTEKQPYPLVFGVFKLAKFTLNIMKLFGDKIIFIDNNKHSEILRCVINCLKSDEIKFDLLLVDKIDSEYQPLWEQTLKDKQLTRGLNPSILNQTPEIVRKIDFPATYDEYLASLSRKSRYKYKKSFEKFGTKFEGDFRFETFKSQSSVKEFFSYLNDIYKLTWQAKTFGLKERNDDKTIALHEVIANQNQFLSYVLFIENKPIAFILGYACSQEFLYFEIGYDENFKNFEPGKVLAWMLIDDLYKHHKIKSLDFDTGENNYKKVLGNSHYYCNKLLLTKSYSVAAFLIRVQIYLRKTYKFIHKIIEKLGVDGKIRKIIKS
ncbi:MAG: hypothetical protein ACI9LM_000970 [Alteromonadaceae bacterium]|jgi:hypothetical protein